MKNNKIRKRCEKRKCKIISESLRIFAANAAGINCKLKSFERILTRLKPQIWMLQETKLKRNGKVKCESISDYQVFYLNRQNLQGGGLALGVHKNIESTLIREGDDEVEVLAVQTILGKIPIRIIVGYAPQENALVGKKTKFWEFVENEIREAEVLDHGVIFQMDGNLHAGASLIKKDPNAQNRNGKLFMDFLSRNESLFVLNTSDKCKGVITRKRIVESRTEEAVLDFCIINEKLQPFFKEMTIDEERNFCLTNLAQIKRNKRIIESDHNSAIIEFDIKIEEKLKIREELYNFRNKTCQKAFKEATENNKEMLECFDDNIPFENQSKRWKKVLNSVIFKCFKKVRIVQKKRKDIEKKKIFEKMNEMKVMKKDLASKEITVEDKMKLEERIEKMEKELEKEVSEEYISDAMETLRELGGQEDEISGEGRKKMWKKLKEMYPKVQPAVPVGKQDKSGNIVTNHESLKQLYLNTYINRLRNRPISSGFEEIKNLKMNLFELRLKLASSLKSKDWKLEDLEIVLKQLKNNKARDPLGLINELFKQGVAGKDFKNSLLTLFNKIKQENKIPEYLKLADVATIYKGKGSKTDLKNDRGIFLVTVFRSILMRLIYRDTYEILNQNISDSQVGGIKGKSVRNHIWVLNGVICDVLSKKNKNPIDLQIYDYKQCFDSLWLEECMNDIYSGGIKDDKFALLYKINSHVNVAVKTPVGKTNRGAIQRAIIQGDVFGPMMCGKQIDEIGKECLESGKYTYSYKGEVEIPPLIMLDDLISISECGPKSAMANAFIRLKTNTKKLQFGSEKCKKIHIGKYCDQYKCLPLFVESWEEKELETTKSCDPKQIKINDVMMGEEEMELKDEEKYLGDIISSDGKNSKNIQARVNKGKGIVRNILSMLEGIPFGKHFYEVAVILRNSLLVSSVLFNCEAWYNLTKTELKLLESVDLCFLRAIFKAPKSTPIEMFYLELGILPLKEIIRKRRLGFLHYILRQSKESMISQFFEAQKRYPTSKDWVTMIKCDLKILNMNLEFDDIKIMEKKEFMNKVSEKIIFKAKMDLNALKENHSKVRQIEHHVLKMQKYLKPNNEIAKIEEKQLLFKLRCRTTDVKMNKKGLYEDYSCRACGLENESQKHITTYCENLRKNNNENQTIEYEKLFGSDISAQKIICKQFKQNMRILEEYENTRIMKNSPLGPSDQMFSVSAVLGTIEKNGLLTELE